MQTTKSQRGSAILLLMMLMCVASLAMLHITKERKQRDAKLEAMAWSNALKQVCAAADTYATRNWSVVSVQPTTTLTTADLAGVPPLTGDVAATLAGVAVTSSISMSPVGCDAMAGLCRPDVHVWTGALPGTDAKRQALGNAIVKRVGELASIALPENPSLFVARNHSRTDPNPSNIAGAVLLRCGEANNLSSDSGVRGNATMSGMLSAGSNNLTSPELGAGVAQINLAPGAACTEQNSFALDGTGRYMYCDGATWQSAAKPVIEQRTQHVSN